MTYAFAKSRWDASVLGQFVVAFLFVGLGITAFVEKTYKTFSVNATGVLLIFLAIALEVWGSRYKSLCQKLRSKWQEKISSIYIVTEKGCKTKELWWVSVNELEVLECIWLNRDASLAVSYTETYQLEFLSRLPTEIFRDTLSLLEDRGILEGCEIPEGQGVRISKTILDTARRSYPLADFADESVNVPVFPRLQAAA